MRCSDRELQALISQCCHYAKKIMDQANTIEEIMDIEDSVCGAICAEGAALLESADIESCKRTDEGKRGVRL